MPALLPAPTICMSVALPARRSSEATESSPGLLPGVNVPPASESVPVPRALSAPAWIVPPVRFVPPVQSLALVNTATPAPLLASDVLPAIKLPAPPVKV